MGIMEKKREVYAGSVVVLNVKTGEVISMVKLPRL